MLGSNIFTMFSSFPEFETIGIARSRNKKCHIDESVNGLVICDLDIASEGFLVDLFRKYQPEVIINCIGCKLIGAASSIFEGVRINSIFPHKLAAVAAMFSARTIHISSDGVFAADQVSCKLADEPRAFDIYGLSKKRGELERPLATTIRTSFLGLNRVSATELSLLSWFLQQTGTVKGYRNVMYNGVTTIEICKFLRSSLNHHIPDGIIHLSSERISKYELLCLVKNIFKVNVTVVPDDSMVISRTLDSNETFLKTGYVAPAWRDMIFDLKQFAEANRNGFV